jgi:hypothetical protein
MGPRNHLARRDRPPMGCDYRRRVGVVMRQDEVKLKHNPPQNTIKPQ